MAAAAEGELSVLVREQLLELLGDPSVRASLLGGAAFTGEARDTLEGLQAQVGSLMQDRSLGSVLNGPVWMNGASVVNGTITADKLTVNSLEAVTTNTGTLNVTGTMTAAASFPATGARVVINASGLWGYSGAATTTFKLNVDGSGEIGTGANKVVWTTAGVVTIPAATIGSLTIAAVGGGILGGTYQTATAGAHINLSTAGIVAYNATSEISANETFKLNAATGAMTATGSFTVQSAASGARVVINSAGGIEGFTSGGVSTFRFNAADGSGYVGGTGSGTNGISWNSSGTVSIGGASFSSGKITASSLSISSLSAITADAGTITAGSITASTITAGTFINGSTGTINLGAADLVVNSSGKLKFGASSADYLSNNLLHFEVDGTESATVEWKNGANSPYGYLSGAADSSRALSVIGSSYDSTHVAWASCLSRSSYSEVWLFSEAGSVGQYQTGVGVDADDTAANNSIGFSVGSNTSLVLGYTNRAANFYGYIYPGTGSATQASRYIYDASSNINIVTDTLYISGNSGAAGLRFTNIANGGSAGNWSSWGGATGAAYWKVNIGGTNYRVPFLADA